MTDPRSTRKPEGCSRTRPSLTWYLDALTFFKRLQAKQKRCCYSMSMSVSLCLLLSWASLLHAANAEESVPVIKSTEQTTNDTEAVDANETDGDTTTVGAKEMPKLTSVDSAQRAAVEDKVANLDKPLYNPFIERFLLDEVKNIRSDMQSIRAELIEKVVEKELAVADKSMSYATGAVTYFFYLIAGISTLLVLVGWNSIRDIKQRMRDFAENEVTRIAEKYETRLQNIEEEMSKKSRKIYHAQKEIDRTNELHSLWLKASLETIPQNKIAVYDQILALKPDDIEALTYKADAALLLGEATWAISLCNRALEQDENNSHAFYQRACAYAETDYNQEALRDLALAIGISEAFRDAAPKDGSFKRLWESEEFQRLTRVGSFVEEVKDL